jgi:Na+/H+ antiporter NhaD/arsenite permease-like protein
LDPVVLAIFVVVYLSMILGRLPGLALDRTGVVLVGAIAMIASGHLTSQQAWDSVDIPTVGMLFGLMIVSAQFGSSGFYGQVTARLSALQVGDRTLLLVVIIVTGVLSALLTNDIVVFAMTPVLLAGCIQRRLDPIPFMLGAMCAANIGSAATLIGNPQVIFIGQRFDLSFNAYLLDSLVPVLLSLVVSWLVICLVLRGSWSKAGEGAGGAAGGTETELPPYIPYQALKAVVAITAIVLAYILTDWPHEVVALAVAALLLMSRTVQSRRILDMVDWQLLLLFIGLFIVNHAMDTSGTLKSLLAWVNATGINLSDAGALYVTTAVASNLVSNVPAVMLLANASQSPLAGPIMAISSTFAGNLLLVGSLSNLILLGQAERVGVTISWAQHARIGLPVGLISLVIAAAWLWFRFEILA